MAHDRTTPRLICDTCGRQYTWRAELAGRTVKCRCGQVMVAPPHPPDQQEPDAQDLYDVAPEPVATPPQPRLPPNTATVAPQQPPALEYQRPGAAGADVLELYFPDRVKDLYMPLALIAGGTAIEVGMALLRRGSVDHAAAALFGVGVHMIVNTGLMLIAIFIVAKLRAISFGPVPTAILKLCGISIGPGAVGALAAWLLGWIPLGFLVGWLIGFVLYFALIGALFDLDEADTWWCVIIIVAVKLAVVLLLFRLILPMF